MEDEKKFEILSNFVSNLAGDQKTIVESLQHGDKDRYLFRGLRTDGEGWVYGSLQIIQYRKEYYIEEWVYKESSEVYYQNEYQVVPESVGQWTGIKDKWDQMIFEGDIIKSDYLEVSGRVIYDTRSTSYHLVEPEYNEHVCIHTAYDYEVIGNIHEGKK